MVSTVGALGKCPGKPPILAATGAWFRQARFELTLEFAGKPIHKRIHANRDSEGKGHQACFRRRPGGLFLAVDGIRPGGRADGEGGASPKR